MVKIAIFEVEKEEKKLIKNFLKRKVRFFKRPLDLKIAKKIRDVEILGIFIYSKIDRKILDELPKLKYIVTFSTGYDHIDLKECKKRKIKVSNVPEYSSKSVAEHTMGLILCCTKKLYDSIKRVKEGDFSLEGLEGIELFGKTIGIVGTGKIGSEVAKLARCFGMKVLAYSKHKKRELERLGIRYVSYKNLLKNSDIITFHVPLNKETYHMFNKSHLDIVKKDCIIINTSRGPIIDTEALLEGIKNKKIKFVGLDVLEEECEIKEERELLSEVFKKKCDFKKVVAEHILKELPNVYVTPHNAWFTKEAQKRVVEEGCKNIISFLKKRPRNIIKF